MPTKKLNCRYVSAYRQRKADQGLIQKNVWVPAQDSELVRQFADWRCHLHEQRKAG